MVKSPRVISAALVVLAVAVGVSVQYRQATNAANEAAIRADIYAMRQAIASYHEAHGVYPESIDALIDAGLYRRSK